MVKSIADFRNWKHSSRRRMTRGKFSRTSSTSWKIWRESRQNSGKNCGAVWWDNIRIDEKTSTVVFRGGIEITISYVETRFERGIWQFCWMPYFLWLYHKMVDLSSWIWYNIWSEDSWEMWERSKRTIETTLTNEKYIGDVILYKTFSPNFPEKKRIPNNGEHQKYIQEDHHPAIISREMFRAVQEMRESRSNIERHADGTVTRKAKRYTGKKE